MKSIKSIVAGSVFIIVVILLMQLAFIFIAVAYNALAKDYPLLNEVAGSFRYLVGMPVFLIIMFLGGYITASVANVVERITVLLLCASVGLLTIGAMMYSALEYAELTLTGLVIFISAFVATVGGGLYWQKQAMKTPVYN